MKIPFELTVALRYLRSKRRGPISLITAITVGGVAVGVCALTVVTSVWNGFEAEFLDKLLGINAHAVVLRNHDVFRDFENVREKIMKEPGVTFAQPFVYSEVLIQSAKGVSGVAIKGVVPELIRETAFSKYVDDDVFLNLARDEEEKREPGILIGKELQETLHVSAGDPVTIISPYGGANGQPRTQEFRVVSIFHTGMYESDTRLVLVDLAEAQKFFRLYKTVTGLEVWTEDPLTSNQTITKAVASIDPENPFAYDARDWSRANRGLFGAVHTQKRVITIVLAAIIVVASFNIVSTLILLILEKGREIAVLKALGASDRSILAIFFLDGQMIGLVGCALGIFSGLALCAILEQYGLKLDPRVYYLENLPIVVRPLEVAVVAFGALFAATIATTFPALRAASLSPVDGLRQGRVARTAAAKT